MKITHIYAREILDSRGNPTVEVEINDSIAIVPSGASTGIHEAHELRDGGDRFHGQGVSNAVNNVNTKIKNSILDAEFSTQYEFDMKLNELDGTKNKNNLGANAILGCSIAFARAKAKEEGLELYQYLGNIGDNSNFILPVPFCNIINGGQHAGNKLAMQEFMIAPVGASSFKEAAQMASEVYHTLKKLIANKYGKDATAVGDEGGFAPNIDTAYDALDLIVEAINKSGYEGKIKIAMDPAASEYFVGGKYEIEKTLSSDEMGDYYLDLALKYPIISIEDPFDQDDFDSFANLLPKAKEFQIVGDDLLVTNVERIKICNEKKLCNALLLKINQIGTISEAIDAAKLAKSNGWDVMVSHRSGESEDAFISDLAVGLGSGQIKLGAPARSDRVAKYNQLLRLEDKFNLKYGN